MAANLALFSRSFTLGNLAVMKDALNGAPAHVKAALEAELGAEGANKATAALRRKAFTTVLTDVGIFFAINGLVQGAAGVVRNWEDGKGPLEGLAAGAKDYLTHFGVPQMWNEPGKHNRAFVGLSPENRGEYARIPPGKVGEEMLSWMPWVGNPGKLAIDKMSPVLRSLAEVVIGKDTLGRDVYDPSPQTFLDQIGRARDIALHLVGASVPLDEIKNMRDIVTGQAREPLVTAARIVGPLTGAASISEGRSGGAGFDGPQMAQMNADKDHETFLQRKAYELAVRLHTQGRDDDARAAIEQAHPNDPRTANSVMRSILTPDRNVLRQVRQFERRATDEQKSAVEHVNH